VPWINVRHRELSDPLGAVRARALPSAFLPLLLLGVSDTAESAGPPATWTCCRSDRPASTMSPASAAFPAFSILFPGRATSRCNTERYALAAPRSTALLLTTQSAELRAWNPGLRPRPMALLFAFPTSLDLFKPVVPPVLLWTHSSHTLHTLSNALALEVHFETETLGTTLDGWRASK